MWRQPTPVIPQHFSSTWWLGDPVKLWVQTKSVYNASAASSDSLWTQYSQRYSSLLKEKEWNTLWISAKWIDLWREKKHNQSSCSRRTIITGQLIMNRMSENWSNVGSWRMVDSNYIWFSGWTTAKRLTLLLSMCFVSHECLVSPLLSSNQCIIRIMMSSHEWKTIFAMSIWQWFN